jgi:anti-anti-sigma factor
MNYRVVSSDKGVGMNIEKDGELSLIRLPERFAGPMVREVSMLVRNSLGGQLESLLVDFTETKFIDSSAIGLLVSCAKDFKARGSMFCLRNLNENVKELFSETGLDMIFNIETQRGLDSAKIDIFEESVNIRLDIKKETLSDVCILHLNGVMNHPRGSRFFKQQFLLAMAYNKKIIINLDGLTFFDSLSVSVMLNMNKLLKETGGSLRLCGANYIIDDLFTTLNINQIIPLYEDTNAALAEWK